MTRQRHHFPSVYRVFQSVRKSVVVFKIKHSKNCSLPLKIQKFGIIGGTKGASRDKRSVCSRSIGSFNRSSKRRACRKLRTRKMAISRLRSRNSRNKRRQRARSAARKIRLLSVYEIFQSATLAGNRTCNGVRVKCACHAFTTDYPSCSTNNYVYRGVSLHLLRVAAARPQR